MDELLKKREEILLNINKYQKKLFSLQSDLINIEKETAKFSEVDIIKSLTLSEQQQKIVDADQENILVIACPGAGKTHTLISRYVNLILVKEVKPESVLLITFTNKAGQEMLKRMEEIIPSKLPFYVGSLHGLSYRILQKYYSINYTILDEYETRELIKNETNLFFATFNGLVIEEDDMNYIKYKICDIIDQISTTYPLNFKPILKKYNLIKYNNIIQQIYKAFSKKKKIENYIDFNDLMIMFCDFLKNPKSDDFKNQIKYVFFDEYQDINQIQNYILSVFKNKSKIMVVGDDAQSIYSFRGSSVNFILDFPTIFTPNEKYLLVENYRSTPSIVNFCEEIIKKNTNQFKKEVKSIQDQFGVLPDIHAFDKKISKEFTTREDQYRWIINDIIEKYNNGVKLSDIVILARKNDIINKIEIELISSKLPFIKQLGISLLDKPHIKDFFAFIIILNNKKSSIHFKRVISLHKGFDVNKANDFVNKSDYNILNQIKEESKTNNEMLSLISFFNQIRDIKNEIDKGKYILTYLENLWLSKNRNFESERKEILNLLFYLRNGSLIDFINTLYLNRTIDNDGENKVFLSTVHGSKGLEWNHVYIIDVNNTDFPSIRMNYFKDELDDMEEERRLFYVACSRAKKYLTITYHVDKNSDISPFIREIDDTLYFGNNIIKDNVVLSNNIPKDVSLIIKNYGHQNICDLLKNLNTKEKILHTEFLGRTHIIKNKKYIGNFFDYLIPKIIQNHYPDKIKKFDLNIVRRNENFPKKNYHDYIDQNTHWSVLLENIFYTATYNSNDNEINKIKDLLINEESITFYKELENGIIKLIDMFKPKTILSHYNINFDLLKAELDLLLDDTIIEIKFSEKEICNLEYICQALTYGFLMFKKGIKINKVCLYNVKTGIINIIDTSIFDFNEFYKRFYQLKN